MIYLRGQATEQGDLATERLAQSYEERGQQALLASDTDTALAFLSEALRIGDDTPAVRFMIARALDPLRAEVTTLRGHRGEISTVLFSPDGSRVLTMGSDGTARVWDSRDGHTIVILGGHALGLVAAAWSPDGRRIATGDSDGKVRLWTSEGRLVVAVSRSAAVIRTIAFTKDGGVIAAGSKDGFVTLWDSSNAASIASWRADDAIAFVTFDKSRRLLVSGFSGKVALWSVDGKLIAQLTEHTEPVWFARFSPSEDRIATASLDGTARVWNPSGKSIPLRGHVGRVTDVAWSPSGTLVATAGIDRTARVWDASTGESRAILRGHTAQLNRVEFTHDGLELITVANDGTARIWDTTTGMQTATLFHAGFVADADLDGTGTRLATVSWTGTGVVWDLQQQPHIATLVGPPADQATTRTVGGHALFVANHETLYWADPLQPPVRIVSDKEVLTADLSTDAELVLGDSDGSIQIIDVGNTSSRVVVAAHTAPVLRLAISPDGRIASWGEDQKIEIDDRRGHVVATRPLHVVSNAASLDQVVLAFAPRGDRLVAYDMEADEVTILGKSLEPIAHLAIQAYGASFSPDGQLATGGKDRIPRVWDRSGGLVVALPNAHFVISIVAFDPTAPFLVVGGLEGSIQVWNTTNWQLVAERKAHDGYVGAIAFSSDGQFMATASGDHVVNLWHVRTGTQVGSIPSDDEVGSLVIDSGGRLFESGKTAFRTNVWRPTNLYDAAPTALADVARCRTTKIIADGRLVARPPCN